jgi:hypothetical protein
MWSGRRRSELNADARTLLKAEFSRIAEDANYSAQSYYEASKGAEFWGKTIVFLPAVVAAVSSFLVALGQSRLWGVVSAVSAVITATASFLGAQRQAVSFRASGNSFTKIRHNARMWCDSLVDIESEDESKAALMRLRKEYDTAIDQLELPSTHYFKRASKRIASGVLKYQENATGTAAGGSTGQ